MQKSMWWSHIQLVEALVIKGNEPDPEEEERKRREQEQLGTGGAGTGTPDPNTAELDPQKKILALTEEKDRHWSKAQEAEQKLQEAAQELEELRQFKEKSETAKLSDQEKVQRELDQLRDQLSQKDQKIAELQNNTKQLAIQNAFLADKQFQWHKPERALALVDLSDVQVDDNGSLKNPDALTKAIKALAESDPYLVNTSEGNERKTWEGKTGDKVKNQKPQSEVMRNDELRKKYPALRR